MEVKKKTIIIFSLLVLLLMKYSFGDVLDFLRYIGASLLPSRPTIGYLLILTVLLIAIFFKEINELFSRIKLRR